MDVAIRPREPEDDAAIVGIRSRIDSDLPPYTVEQYRHRLASRPHGWHEERHVAEMGGRVVGSAGLWPDFWRDEPGAYRTVVEVEPRLWGRGIGSRLHDWLMGNVDTSAVAGIYARARAEAGLRFAERRGYRRTGRTMQESRLTVAEANLKGFEGVEERLAEAGIRIATLAELGQNENLLRGLWQLELSSGRDIPDSGLSADLSFDEWCRTQLHEYGVTPDVRWVAIDGDKPVGIASLECHEGGRSVSNDYTGVLREYTGRGIARALKCRTVEWARAKGIEYIYTGNLLHNRRMLDINVRLGYQWLPASHELLREMPGE